MKEIEIRQNEVINKLNSLTSSYSYVYVLARICHRDFCGTLEGLSSKNIKDHLNYNEYAFLIGLWLKNANSGDWLTDKSEGNAFEKTYSLMEELHSTFRTEFSDFLKSGKKDFYEFVEHSSAFKESFFYAGTGAYDFQYTKWLSDKYKDDHKWLKNKLSIDLDSLKDFYRDLKSLQQVKLNIGSRKSNLRLNDSELLDVFCLDEKDMQRIDRRYGTIVKKFTYDLLTDRNLVSEIGDFNSYIEKPIIRLPDDRLFIPVAFSVAEALYESPFFWMNTDEEYRDIALKNRGKAAENITFKIIGSVFQRRELFKEIKILKSKGAIVTDIDVLAMCNKQAIIFQVKSKRLTTLSKKGDITSIKNDFKKSVKAAFEQATISRDCLLNSSKYQFVDENGRAISFGEINHCLIVIVVLDNYPAINHQAHVLLRNELDDSPIALNIFDLEIVARYLSTPLKFIDYISKRIQFSNYYRADSEMAYLSFHLKKGLKKYDKYDGISLDESWGQQIDRSYYPEIAGLDKLYETTSFKKIGRNEACPCGSGKKYKYCHGKAN